MALFESVEKKEGMRRRRPSKWGSFELGHLAGTAEVLGRKVLSWWPCEP
jgi:hypothetical protein